MLTKVRAFIFGGVLALTSAAFVAAPTFAAAYGAGNYNNCSYTCPPKKTEETKVTLSSGLVVSINLSNGQKISPDGYVVIVQPASGQKDTLKKVDFYLDDALQFTDSPNELGAVRWLWKPEKPSGNARIKIIITAADSTTTTQEFSVQIAKPSSEPVIAAPTKEEKTDVVSTVSRALVGFVATLPTPIVHGLPYLLFTLLVINILLLLVQTQRELREIAVLQGIIRRERNTGIEKNAFVSLASHYLRTPLSIIQGGFDLLNHTTNTPPKINDIAQKTIESLRLKVDSLLTRTDAAAQIAGVTDDAAMPSIWKKPGLYLPIILIGLFVFIFDYVAGNVEIFDVNQLNVIVQLVIFVLLVVVFYQVYRRHQLHKRDSEGMQRALTHEQTINQTRDELITESTQLLSGDLQTLRDIAKDLPESDAQQFIVEGIQRFRSVLGKFAIAGQLRSGRTAITPTTTSLQALLQQLPQPLNDRLAKKDITVNISGDAPFIVGNPQLVGYILASLIDNAADYSTDHATIDVRAQPQHGQAAITVTDHGAGISSQKMAMLFKPFSQTQDVKRFTHEGMGFSLYLDKLIMTYLGGDISLTSKPNVETVATITLPQTS